MWWLKSPDKKLSIPDWLSVYRIISAPFLLVLMWLELRFLFGIFIMISFLTDALDGFLARKLNVVSQRGAQLDSIGDAITFVVGVFGIIWFEYAFVRTEAMLLITAFGLYFFQLSIAYWRYGMPSSFHTYLAKIAAIVQAVFIVWVMLFGVVYWLFYAAIILSIVETVEEIILIIRFPKWKANIKGLFWVINENKKIKSVSSKLKTS